MLAPDVIPWHIGIPFAVVLTLTYLGLAYHDHRTHMRAVRRAEADAIRAELDLGAYPTWTESDRQQFIDAWREHHT